MNGRKVVSPAGDLPLALTEIIAGLIAMLADGPVHIASDNKSFVDRANAFRQTLDIKRKDWSLVTNGDLWEIFCKVLRAKGPLSVCFSWTKGHAEQKTYRCGHLYHF